MAWGDSIAAAWENASDPARQSVLVLADGTRTAISHTAAAIQFLAREAHVITKTTAEAAETANRAALVGIQAAGEKAAEAGKKGAAIAAQSAKALGRGSAAAGRVSALLVRAAFRRVQKLFGSAVAGGMFALCTRWNWLVCGLALRAGTVLTKPNISDLIRPLLRLGDNPAKKDCNDGAVVGAGCKHKSTDNPTGVMPARCLQEPGALPKITYINGINTQYDQKGPSLCTTLHKIADTTCSEVTGVYNATGGTLKDVDECLDNIKKASNTPAVVPLRNMIVDAALRSQQLTLFAHSQGGLITQEAVAQAKQQLIAEHGYTADEAEVALNKVTVKSFGTAAMGWPKGPLYERYTNTSDPIPGIIAGAQTSYPIETLRDSANSRHHYVFTDPHLNPINSHSMDAVYMAKYGSVDPKQCKCAEKGPHAY